MSSYGGDAAVCSWQLATRSGSDRQLLGRTTGAVLQAYGPCFAWLGGTAEGSQYDVPGTPARISFTRPTSPVSRRTLIPWGCVGDFVNTSFTTPLVRVPLRWSCFCTIRTSEPGLILFLSMALIGSFPRNTSRFGGGSSFLVLSFQEQASNANGLQLRDLQSRISILRIPSDSGCRNQSCLPASGQLDRS